ncbi:family 10 glycosylhydrolase [candidate division KSB1 bacterium]|nr:family 10 glycosylhydrolase [candidate division KSB1 bacterium]
MRFDHRFFFLIHSFILFTFFPLQNLFPRDEGQTRALWITRWDYQTPSDLQKIITNAKEFHFNVLLFQVRGNATVSYPSKIEPWSAEFEFQNPGWDPLRIAIDLAHAQGIECHAWINVFPGWRGQELPAPAQQLYNTHRDWFMMDEYGNSQQLNSHYVWLSPTHPEVQEYLLKVCAEIYRNYDIDGLHLDYIRFPGTGYSYDPLSLRLFKVQTGFSPAEQPFSWSNWRREAINSFISTLYNALKNHNPDIILSASVVGDYYRGSRVLLQDSHGWLARGIIDVIYPMIYTTDNVLYKRELLEHLYNAHNRHVYPGIKCENSDQLKSQLVLASELECPGVAVFSYSLLFPNHFPDYSLTSAISSVWGNTENTSALPWKKYVGDSQGPTITEVKTVPANLRTNNQFKIAAHIIDPSGVYDDNTGSEGKGIYLIYDKNWPPADGIEIKMSPVKNSKDWYITDKPIPPQNIGLNYRCRIFAWDNFFVSSEHPKRNLGYSDIWSFSILLPGENFISAGQFGPVLWQPSDILVDADSKIWVGCALKYPLVVVLPNGYESDLSPITKGRDEKGEELFLNAVSSLALSPLGFICAVDPQNPYLIYRFDEKTGKSLNGIKINFPAGAIDCDGNGNIFIMERSSTRWHILDKNGKEYKGGPFGGGHIGNDIAVLDDGVSVFISNKSTNSIQLWHGAIAGNSARFWRGTDPPAVDVGLGQIQIHKSDYVHISHSRRGIITIFDRTGYPVEHLAGGDPPLNAPKNIGINQNNDTLYVMESSGVGPTRLIKWVKKNNKEEK